MEVRETKEITPKTNKTKQATRSISHCHRDTGKMEKDGGPNRVSRTALLMWFGMAASVLIFFVFRFSLQNPALRLPGGAGSPKQNQSNQNPFSLPYAVPFQPEVSNMGAEVI